MMKTKQQKQEDHHYLGMRPGDLDGKPYGKYWNPEMAPSLPPHVTEALHRGEEARELGFCVEDAPEQLGKSGYLPLENGYTTLDNGQIFVAVRTDMRGTTPQAMEWWMGWHPQEHQRYKLWHPRAHVANGTKEMLADDPNLSDKQKYQTTHYVTEYIGNRLERIAITFSDPQDYFDCGKPDITTDLGQAHNDTTSVMICGRINVQWAPFLTVGYLIHQLRFIPSTSNPEEGGGNNATATTQTELRSRFWLGKPEIQGPIGSITGFWPLNWIVALIRFLLLPRDFGPSMIVHCAMEMNHLATFLPDLYDDYHPAGTTSQQEEQEGHGNNNGDTEDEEEDEKKKT